MKTIDAYFKLKELNKDIFTTQDIRNILNIEDDNYLIIFINRMIKKEFLISIKRGVYYLKDRIPSEFTIANYIYTPSYISLETALVYYGIINQVTYTVTSVSSKEAKTFFYDEKEYRYSNIKPSLFFTDNVFTKFNIASKEKSIIDTIYFAALRGSALNNDEWDLSDVDIAKLRILAADIDSNAFTSLFNHVIK